MSAYHPTAAATYSIHSKLYAVKQTTNNYVIPVFSNADAVYSEIF